MQLPVPGKYFLIHSCFSLFAIPMEWCIFPDLQLFSTICNSQCKVNISSCADVFQYMQLPLPGKYFLIHSCFSLFAIPMEWCIFPDLQLFSTICNSQCKVNISSC